MQRRCRHTIHDAVLIALSTHLRSAQALLTFLFVGVFDA